MLLVYIADICRNACWICRDKLSKEQLKANFQSISVVRSHIWNLFCVFLKISLYANRSTLSDRAEIFTADTFKIGPEVKSAVFDLDHSIQIYRVLKAEALLLTKYFDVFFPIEKDESEIFEKAQNSLWSIGTGTYKSIFSPTGQDMIAVSLSRIQNQKFFQNSQNFQNMASYLASLDMMMIRFENNWD